MNYAMILKHMKGLKTFPYWRFGAPWLRMGYDSRSEYLYVAYRNWSTKKIEDISESNMIIMPNDQMILTGEQSSTLLGSLGISARFRKRTSGLARNLYVHNCMVEYEYFSGMKVNFRTGKPIDAKRIDQLSINIIKKKEVDQMLAEMRQRYCVLARLKDLEFTADIASTWLTKNIKRYKIETEQKRSDALIKVVTNYKKDGHWSEKLTPLLYHATRNTDYQLRSIQLDPANLFDKVMKIHKSAVYRHTGVIT